MNNHPYQDLPKYSFWRPSVAERNMFEIGDLWQPKFAIVRETRIATFGSCFAQHIGKSLKERDYSWVNCEVAPAGLSRENSKRYNYDVFSARTGNMYTSSILKQWTEWAAGKTTPPDEAWQADGRYIDPFRPTIEPHGFASEVELYESRAVAIESFRQSIISSDVFVFTLGLTESWFNKIGYEYPLCPGTAGGVFDPDTHFFVNQDYNAVRESLVAAFSLMISMNPNLQFILTVSPVPLVATKADRHVLVSTMVSKSILRAVADSVSSMRIEDHEALGRDIVINGGFEGGDGWTVFGSHVVAPNGLAISGPSPNPFRGIWQRMSSSVRSGDRLIVTVETEPETELDVAVSPDRNTRRSGKREIKQALGSKVDFSFSIDWSGEAYLWLGSAKGDRDFVIKRVACWHKSPNAGLIDYFPSYEIINSPAFGGVFFESNKREVSAFGVNFVMNKFFGGIGEDVHNTALVPRSKFDEICDEAILGSFAGATR